MQEGGQCPSGKKEKIKKRRNEVPVRTNSEVLVDHSSLKNKNRSSSPGLCSGDAGKNWHKKEVKSICEFFNRLTKIENFFQATRTPCFFPHYSPLCGKRETEMFKRNRKSLLSELNR